MVSEFYLISSSVEMNQHYLWHYLMVSSMFGGPCPLLVPLRKGRGWLEPGGGSREGGGQGGAEESPAAPQPSPREASLEREGLTLGSPTAGLLLPPHSGTPPLGAPGQLQPPPAANQHCLGLLLSPLLPSFLPSLQTSLGVLSGESHQTSSLLKRQALQMEDPSEKGQRRKKSDLHSSFAFTRSRFTLFLVIIQWERVAYN